MHIMKQNAHSKLENQVSLKYHKYFSIYMGFPMSKSCDENISTHHFITLLPEVHSFLLYLMNDSAYMQLSVKVV